MNRRRLEQDDFLEERSELSDLDSENEKSVPLEKYKQILRKMQTEENEESLEGNSSISMSSLMRTENDLKEKNEHLFGKNNGVMEKEIIRSRQFLPEGEFLNSGHEPERHYALNGPNTREDLLRKEKGFQQRNMTLDDPPPLPERPTNQMLSPTDTLTLSHINNTGTCTMSLTGNRLDNTGPQMSQNGLNRDPFEGEKTQELEEEYESSISAITPGSQSESEQKKGNTSLLIQKIEDLDCTDYLKKFQAKRDEMYSLLSASRSLLKEKQIDRMPEELESMSSISSSMSLYQKPSKSVPKKQGQNAPKNTTGQNSRKNIREGQNRKENGTICMEFFDDLISDKETLQFLVENFRSQRINFDDLFEKITESFRFLASAHPSVLAILESDLRESLCLASGGKHFFVSLNALELVTRKKGLKSFLKSAIQKSQKKLDDQEASFKTELNEEITNELASVNQILIAKKEEMDQREAQVRRREEDLALKEQSLRECIEAFAMDQMAGHEQKIKGEINALGRRFANVQKLMASKLTQMEAIKKSIEMANDKKAADEKKIQVQVKRYEKIATEQKNKISEMEKMLNEQTNENQKLKGQISKMKSAQNALETSQNSKEKKSNESFKKGQGRDSLKIDTFENEGNQKINIFKKKKSGDEKEKMKEVGTQTFCEEAESIRNPCVECQKRKEKGLLKKELSSPKEEKKAKKSANALISSHNEEPYLIRAALQLIPACYSPSSTVSEAILFPRSLLELFPSVFGPSNMPPIDILPFGVQFLLRVAIDPSKIEAKNLSGPFWRKVQKGTSASTSFSSSISSKSIKQESSRLPLLRILNDKDAQIQTALLLKQYLKANKVSLSLKTIQEDLSEFKGEAGSKRANSQALFFLLTLHCALTCSFEDWKYFLVIFKHFVKSEVSNPEKAMDVYLEETHLHIVLRSIIAFVLEHASCDEDIETAMEAVIIISTVPEWSGILVAIFDLELIQLLSLLIQAALATNQSENVKAINKGANRESHGKMGIVEKGLIVMQRALNLRAQEKSESLEHGKSSSTTVSLPENTKKNILGTISSLKKEISKDSNMEEDQRSFIEMNISSIIRMIK